MQTSGISRRPVHLPTSKQKALGGPHLAAREREGEREDEEEADRERFENKNPPAWRAAARRRAFIRLIIFI
jgi:hypothetical protein